MVTSPATIQPTIAQRYNEPEMIVSSKNKGKETNAPNSASTAFMNLVILSGELQYKPEWFELEVIGKKAFEKFLKITLLTMVAGSQKELHVLAISENEAEQYKKLKPGQSIYINGYLKSGTVREQGKLKYQPVVIVKSLSHNITNP